ncbi:unnamed protein product [Closterium sp. Yama58-4]|nr:unnamed protein product [Closterium sp. Yama58-4]
MAGGSVGRSGGTTLAGKQVVIRIRPRGGSIDASHGVGSTSSGGSGGGGDGGGGGAADVGSGAAAAGFTATVTAVLPAGAGSPQSPSSARRREGGGGAGGGRALEGVGRHTFAVDSSTGGGSGDAAAEGGYSREANLTLPGKRTDASAEPRFKGVTRLGSVAAAEAAAAAIAVADAAAAAQAGKAGWEPPLSPTGVPVIPPEGRLSSEGDVFLEYLRKAGEGRAAAQYDVAVCYGGGFGVKQDKSLAAYWFRKAAEQGLARAQYALAECYESGAGVEKDEEEAFRWFFRAASFGSGKYLVKLGLCFERGFGVTECPVAALYWYHKAAEQGPKFAAQVEKRMEVLQRQREEEIMSARGEGVPVECICPLTGRMMEDPVELPETNVCCERAQVKTFWDHCELRCPRKRQAEQEALQGSVVPRASTCQAVLSDEWGAEREDEGGHGRAYGPHGEEEEEEEEGVGGLGNVGGSGRGGGGEREGERRKSRFSRDLSEEGERSGASESEEEEEEVGGGSRGVGGGDTRDEVGGGRRRGARRDRHSDSDTGSSYVSDEEDYDDDDYDDGEQRSNRHKKKTYDDEDKYDDEDEDYTSSEYDRSEDRSTDSEGYREGSRKGVDRRSSSPRKGSGRGRGISSRGRKDEDGSDYSDSNYSHSDTDDGEGEEGGRGGRGRSSRVAEGSRDTSFKSREGDSEEEGEEGEEVAVGRALARDSSRDLSHSYSRDSSRAYSESVPSEPSMRRDASLDEPARVKVSIPRGGSVGGSVRGEGVVRKEGYLSGEEDGDGGEGLVEPPKRHPPSPLPPSQAEPVIDCGPRWALARYLEMLEKLLLVQREAGQNLLGSCAGGPGGSGRGAWEGEGEVWEAVEALEGLCARGVQQLLDDFRAALLACRYGVWH